MCFGNYCCFFFSTREQQSGETRWQELWSWPESWGEEQLTAVVRQNRVLTHVTVMNQLFSLVTHWILKWKDSDAAAECQRKIIIAQLNLFHLDVGWELPSQQDFLISTDTQRSEEITLCNPWTVNRDQILEISATRLHILRLQTRVAPGCLPWRCHWLHANGKSFFFLFTFEPRRPKNTVSGTT